jgi:hypothetical protein
MKGTGFTVGSLLARTLLLLEQLEHARRAAHITRLMKSCVPSSMFAQQVQYKHSDHLHCQLQLPVTAEQVQCSARPLHQDNVWQEQQTAQLHSKVDENDSY